MNEFKAFCKKQGGAFAAVALIVILLLPMLIISLYANAAADDFYRLADMKALYQPGGGIGSYLGAVVRLSGDMYNTWQGAYTVNYLIHLNPMLFWERGYILSYIATVVLFALSAYALCATTLKYLLKDTSVTHKLWLTAVIIFLCTQFITPAESFYWYAGAVAYTIPFIMLELTLCTMIRCHYASGVHKWLWFAASLALTFLNGGGCLMLSFIIPIGLAMYLVCLFVRKSPERLLYLCYFAVASVGLAIQVLSPGSSVRMGMLPHHTLVKTMLLTIQTAAETILSQVSIYPIIALLIALFPLALKVGSALDFKFRYPGLVLVCSVALYAAAFAPVLYGYGGYSLPPRYGNTVYFLLIFLLAGNLFYTAGWLGHHYDLKLETIGKKLVLGVAAAILLTVSMGDFPAAKWATPMITRNIIVGNAGMYREENDKIIAALKSSPGKDVVVTLPKHAIATLKKFDLTDDPESMNNRYMAKYYGNNSIVALPPEE